MRKRGEKMNLFRLGFLNVWRRRNKTILLGVVSAISMCILVSAISVFFSIKASFEISSQRLGADVVIVPDSVEADGEEIMFTGVPKMVYLEESKLKNIPVDKIEKITSQFFIKTLSEFACCTFEKSYRVVGIDQKSDFIMKPWMKSNSIPNLDDRDVILGSNVELEYKDEISIMGKDHKFKGRLEKTGTSIDDTIFVSMKEARYLAREYYDIENKNYFHGIPTDRLISASFIRLKNGIDAEKFVSDIENSIDGVRAYSVAASSQNLKNKFYGFGKLLAFFTIGVIVISLASLFGMFNLMIGERKKEIGFLKTMGFENKELIVEILFEIILIVGVGGAVGSIFGISISSTIIGYLSSFMIIPTNSYDFIGFVQYGIAGVILSLVFSAVISIFPIYFLLNNDPKDIFSDGGMTND
ncbi:ABC transporter permease [Peptostreptococcus porci]|uniref:ABC transporter permease n=2 Tax=Peptostreptococcus porci TaxID=2652282 RepID=UPI0023F19E13|nr:ABC transporter permease [Peptostreptococcus porci]